MNKFNTAPYEYKAPSYERKPRPERITIDTEKMAEDSRFSFADGIYRSKAPTKDEISLLFAGDLLCQESIIQAYRKKGGQYDFTPCYDYVRPLLKAADFTVGNLETPITEEAPFRGEIITHEGPFFCNAPVEYLDALKYAGFDMLTTANNHTIDAGCEGIYDTIQNIRKFDFIQTGTFIKEEPKYVMVDICGIKVGFTAFATSYNQQQKNLTAKGRKTLLNTYTEKRAKEVYESLKAAGAEYIVCFPHWGDEYTEKLTPKQERIAQYLTETGYDFVAGSHAHVIQRFERVNGKPVLYSMGNLMSHLFFTSDPKDIMPYALLCQLNLKRTEDGIKDEIRFIPCKIFKNLEGVPYQVLPFDRNLSVPTAVEKKLAQTPNRIAKLLQGDVAQIQTEYPVDEDAVKKLNALRQAHAERMNSYEPWVNPGAKGVMNVARHKEIFETDGKKWTDRSRYVEDHTGIYRMHDDYAELLYYTKAGTIGKVQDDMNGLPVKQINNVEQCCEEMRIIYLGKRVESIGEGAFRNCPNLESARFYPKLKHIGPHAFENCPKLTGIMLPNSLEEIDDGAFRGCGALLSAKIPPNVKRIGADAFEGCPKLTIYCEAGSYAEAYAKEQGIAVKHMPLQVNREKERRRMDQQIKTMEQESDNGVVMGPRNQMTDPHPITIRAVCELIGVPLPSHAQCKFPPSKYIKRGTFTGNLVDIKALLGAHLPTDIEEEELKKKHRMFRNKFKSQKNITFTREDFTVYFCDWLLYARDRGFTHNCYFDYELYWKEPDVRDTFLNEGYRTRIHRACTTKAFRRIFLDKAEFNRKFAKFVQRDWVDASKCSFEEFKEFAEKHDRFFGKPVRGTGGAGARVIERDSDTLENLYQICKEDELIVEELIKQHPVLNQINASTLNTVRVNTLLCPDGEARILLNVARFGRAGKVADNFHNGGVGAIIDIETGKVMTEAIDQGHMRSPFHPDSHFKILGFQYPEWEQVKQAVTEAAKMIPEMRHVGWDVSVTEAGTVEFVEGNGRANFDVLQSPDQIGRRYRYAKYLPELEAMKGIETVELPPLKVTLQNTGSRKHPRKAVSFKSRVKRMIRKILKRS